MYMVFVHQRVGGSGGSGGGRDRRSTIVLRRTQSSVRCASRSPMCVNMSVGWGAGRLLFCSVTCGVAWLLGLIVLLVVGMRLCCSCGSCAYGLLLLLLHIVSPSPLPAFVRPSVSPSKSSTSIDQHAQQTRHQRPPVRPTPRIERPHRHC